LRTAHKEKEEEEEETTTTTTTTRAQVEFGLRRTMAFKWGPYDFFKNDTGGRA